MLRVYPERENYTSNTIAGLPLIVTSHRGSSAFNLSPYQGSLSEVSSVVNYGYDNEVSKPYFYSVDLDDYDIHDISIRPKNKIFLGRWFYIPA